MRETARNRMAEQNVERRLAAVLAADVVGYSRMMAADEEGTLARLNSCRRELWEPTIAEHRGRVVKRTGDGMLVEFGSAVDAARCAILTQQGMAKRNEGVPCEKRIDIRIGIHVGDIIIEEGDIFGDGVNIAARLEGIAQPGGISLSEDAWRQVQGKVTANFVDAGEQNLKNIPRPVRVYRLELEEKRAAPPAAWPKHEWRSRAGTFLRRPRRRHHYHLVKAGRIAGDRAQFELRLQGSFG